ncbi:MAG: aminotransferase class V-fold PLP-dependent enzyme [Bryobacteraceae bacterium]
MNWSAIRHEFPALSGWTYLNTATFGQLPRSATDAVARHWQRRDETACRNFLDWFDDADRLRRSLARLIYASPDDIAFTPSAAHALALVVNGLRLSTANLGDANVVTLAGDFPNQLYLPDVREVPWERFFESINSQTKLVAISEVNYATGFRPPLGEISRFIASLPKDTRPVLFVDGTQSAGALRFNIAETPVDVYAVHAYKWLISPNGAGFFYIAPELRARITPSVVGWRSDRNWRNVDHLSHGTPVFKDSAEKYEGGGLPSALLYAMEASVQLIQSLGTDAIEERVLSLAAEIRARVSKLGARLEQDTGINQSDCQIVAARFPDRDVSEIAKALAQKRVLVAARHGYLRISPHFYNDDRDIGRLEQELKALV